MLADGNCLFHSQFEGLFRTPAIIIDQATSRARCAQAIRSAERLRNSFSLEADLLALVSELACDGVYGDELSIRAFCHAVQCKVLVDATNENFLLVQMVAQFG